MTPLKFFTRYWSAVGLVSAVIAGIYLAVAWHNLDVLHRILIANFIIVLLHQFEEYLWPGGFPFVANHIFMSMTSVMRPMNQLSSAVANCIFAYVFYLLPLFFPSVIWLALGTFIFGSILQVLGHGVLVNYRIRSLTSPGTITAVLGWLPLGVYYVYYVYEHGLISGWDWPLGVAYTVAGFGIFISIEQFLLFRDDPNFHPFDKDQLEARGIQEKFEAAQRLRAGNTSA
ncbi:HXXEE domain-containing protein [Mycolicibacterium septicum]|uniref:HXXEE domain-containing protein n=1 Tax=Mycolicibacterium septicum TaxID=98668 RepID=UPI002360CF2A|nr:HXXEE domain-containing protein [Mycolicibacterium septicum]